MKPTLLDLANVITPKMRELINRIVKYSEMNDIDRMNKCIEVLKQHCDMLTISIQAD